MKKIFAALANVSLTARVIAGILAFIFFISGISLLWRLNNRFLILVPMAGGSITQGVVGVPQFINPVLASTDSDTDLSALVYSGLLRYGPDGTLIPDLAQSYTLSPDGLTYTFILKKNAVWSDDVPVTADDIVYTISKIQDPALKSPLAPNWQGVTVQKLSGTEVSFTLPQPYSQFIENFTVGILPSHIWSGISDEDFATSTFNAHPIGSGPYAVSGISTSPAGVPLSYTLSAVPTFVLGKPFIGSITLKFYSDQTDEISDYEAGNISEVAGIDPASAQKLISEEATVSTSTLPRVFGLFLNQSQNPVLADSAVRQALDLSANRVYITNTVLQGFGEPIHEPVPPDFFGLVPTANGTTTLNTTLATSPTTSAAMAGSILDKDGWTLNATTGTREKEIDKATTTLAFSISTLNVPELIEVADDLRDEWGNIGIDVTVKVFDGGYLDTNIIEPRSYDSLLFGEVIGKGLDLAPFWDSSQQTAPGLNIALYSNKTVNAAVEAMQKATSTEARNALYEIAAKQIEKDTPAIFLYAPETMYISRQSLHTGPLSAVSAPSDQFNNVYDWYINTENVWKIFARWY